jgi:hypothetical protein
MTNSCWSSNSGDSEGVCRAKKTKTKQNKGTYLEIYVQKHCVFSVLSIVVEPLLCDDRKIGKYTRIVSTQRLSE